MTRSNPCARLDAKLGWRESPSAQQFERFDIRSFNLAHCSLTWKRGGEREEKNVALNEEKNCQCHFTKAHGFRSGEPNMPLLGKARFDFLSCMWK